MTTSLNARLPGYRQPPSTRPYAEAPEPTVLREGDPLRHVSEIRRMKEFAGRSRFKAPVSDDFARGMLASGHDPAQDKKPLAQIRVVLASVILGLTSRCTHPKTDGSQGRDVRDRD